jgi:hypothetical protein
MADDNLPPAPGGTAEISERLQEYNQKVQEQAFLLGYRNGYREGELVQGLLEWVREAQADPDISQERLDTLRDVEHWLASNGAFLQDEQEVTHPPGLLAYLDAQQATPFVQVAGERIHIEDLDFQWDPAPPAPEGRYDGFDPQAESGEITFTIELNLPEDSEERQKLMEFLRGIR